MDHIRTNRALLVWLGPVVEIWSGWAVEVTGPVPSRFLDPFSNFTSVDKEWFPLIFSLEGRNKLHSLQAIYTV